MKCGGMSRGSIRRPHADGDAMCHTTITMRASPTLIDISRTLLRRHGDAQVRWHLANCGKTLFSND